MITFQKVTLLLETTLLLGIKNTLRVLYYRIKKSLGLIKFSSYSSLPPGMTFYGGNSTYKKDGVSLTLFGWDVRFYNEIPQWLHNPFDLYNEINSDQSWERVISSIPKDTDLKDYWELSRFYWVPEFAFKFIEKKDEEYLGLLNRWLDDWILKNPPYKGINWTCGQEAAIRLMNLALASILLEQYNKPSPRLIWLIEVHLNRILPTLSYAIGQENNHGSAESVALYIGGSWLYKLNANQKYHKIAEKGRKWLLNRAMILIQADGTSNQYSTTYHRANLEVFCLAELWRKKNKLEKFSDIFYKRVLLGGEWLYQLTDPQSGDAPNFGPNDGSYLFSFSRQNYRDFRPTVQLVSVLFDASFQAYEDNALFEDRLKVLKIHSTRKTWYKPTSKTYSQGGHFVLRKGEARVYFRFPSFAFRPGHADSLHIDFWIKNRAVFRDAGTFRYVSQNLDKSMYHNTIVFDDQDQMPRLGKFLYAKWLKAQDFSFEETDTAVCAGAGYFDYLKNYHKREVELQDQILICIDTVRGGAKKISLYWRLDLANWSINNNIITDGKVRISIESDVKIESITLKKSKESLYYRNLSDCYLIELIVSSPAVIVTKVVF